MQTPHLIAPRELPDGTISWEEQQPDLAVRIREGDPNIGWLGDERLSLHLSPHYFDEALGREVPRWEVWRRHEDGTSSLVCHKLGMRPDGDALIRGLARNDSLRHDIAGEMLALRAKHEAQVAAAHLEQAEDTADKLHWALSRDLSEPTGRPVRMGGR